MRKIACTRFLLGCNIHVGNALVLVVEGNLEDARFSSLCNVFVGDELVLVLQGKLACTSFIS